MKRLTWLVAGGCLGLASWSAIAAPRAVNLDGVQVHPTRILARFKNPDRAVAPATLATLRSVGLQVQRRYALVAGGVALELNRPVALLDDGELDQATQAERLRSRIEILRASGEFEYVVPDRIVRATLTEPTSDSAYTDGLLWGLRNTGQFGGVLGADVLTNPEDTSENAWDITTGSSDVIVGVVDTGIRYTHDDLRRQMWVNPDEVPGNGVDDDNNGYVDDIYGINAINGAGDPWDDNGHGSHVSGTIGAEANNGKPHVGVAWRVSLMGLKMLDRDGFGTDSDAIQAIDYAVAKGAKILNNSWGGPAGPGSPDPLLRDTIISASTNGVLFVAAAGNSANDNDANPFFPASYDIENVISVAALDRKDELAIFSNFGAVSVDVGAPGVEIYSCWNGFDSDYATIEGTSMAAPHVSGVAALIWSAFPNASMAEVRARILSSAVPVPDLKGMVATGGRVNAFRALNATEDGDLEVTIDPRDMSPVLISSNLPVFVTVNDLFPITNATVWAEVVGTTNVIDFLNDGVAPDAATNDNVYSALVDLYPYTQPPFSNILQFNLNVTAPAKNAYTNLVTYYIVGPPENDPFEGALKVPGLGAFGEGILVGTNQYASLESSEPWPADNFNAARSLWYDWSPAAGGPVIVDTAGSSFDTVLAVYTGPNLLNLTNVVSADDVDGKQQAYVKFVAARGRTYHIQVASANQEDYGTVRLRVQPNGEPDNTPPVVRISAPVDGELFTAPDIEVQGYSFDPEPNASGVREVVIQVNGALATRVSGVTEWTSSAQLDPGLNTIRVRAFDRSENTSKDFSVKVQYVPNEPPNDVFGTVLSPASPFYLTEVSGSDHVVTDTATKEFDEPLHGGNEGGHSVWWTFKAPASGVLELDTIGSDFDTLLGLYLGERVNRLTTVAENDDATPEVRYSKISQAVQGGLEYRIALDGYGGDHGEATLNYAFTGTNTVTVTVSATTGGTTRPAPGSYDVVAGSTFTLAAEPEPTFVFSGWKSDVAVPPNNPISIPVDSDLSLEAMFVKQQFTDDFETGDFSRLPWRFGGDQPWEITDAEVDTGVFAARSGAIGNHQSSSLFLDADLQDGTGSFALRVSSEADWDFFRFLVDGKEIEKVSGEQDWLRYEFPIAAGRHTLEWRYEKDARDMQGLDAAFIDNLDLPLVVPSDPNQPPMLSIRTLFDGQLEVLVNGQNGQTYIIQGADNPTGRWQNLSTNVATQGAIHFMDPDAAVEPLRFYRARTVK